MSNRRRGEDRPQLICNVPLFICNAECSTWNTFRKQAQNGKLFHVEQFGATPKAENVPRGTFLEPLPSGKCSTGNIPRQAPNRRGLISQASQKLPLLPLLSNQNPGSFPPNGFFRAPPAAASPLP